MKKRTLGLIIAGVAAASMIGTGFAAWVITGNATDNFDGTIQVDTVTDKSITLDADWATTEDGKVSFVGPASEDQTATNEWLSYEKSDGITEFADLTETLTLTFGLGNDVDASEFDITFKFEVAAANQAGYAASIAAKHINAPTINNAAFDANGEKTFTLSEILAADATTADVVFAFTWGTAFDSENPYTFYNGIAYNSNVIVDTTTKTPSTTNATATDPTIQTVAKNELTALSDNLANAEFKLTVTVAKKSA